MKKRRKTKFGKDKRRKHRHWQVTVYYHDGEKFGRVYTDRAKACGAIRSRVINSKASGRYRGRLMRTFSSRPWE